MKKTLRIGLAGLGRIGKIHLQNLSRLPQVFVAAVSDPVAEARSFADRFAPERSYETFEELLAHPDLDAIAVCSPTDTHADYVIHVARKGKHIFCEKPVDLSLSKVEEVLKVVDETGVKLMIGFNRRFDPNFARVRRMLENGQIGDPHVLKITSRDPGPPPVSYLKSSGGLFLDMVIHDFDMARFIMGSEVKEVFSRAANLVDPAIGEVGDIDTAITILTFENGAMATIDTSRKAVYGYDQRLELFGSKGMVQIGNNTLDNHRYYDDSGSHGALLQHFFLERYMDAYYEETKAFVKALEADEPMPVSGYDGLMAMKIALAAGKSVKENRPVVL